MYYAKIVATAYSFRREIGIVAGVLAALILLPLFAILGLLNNGVQSVSDALVTVDAVNHKVIVRGPSGEVIKELEATTAWPMKGVVTQEFGNPNPPYQLAHSGIDIDGGHGSPVTAFMKGKIIGVGDLMAGCGICVMVDHGLGITSHYAHLSAAKVNVGQEVKPGDVVGLQGETGWAHGSHLHFEIRVARIPVNPRTFMIGNPLPRGR